MATTFPTSLDTFTNPTGGQVQGATTPTHSGHHLNVNDAIEAIEAKLGTGASTPAGLPGVLRSSAGGSVWAEIINADVAAAANIVVSKLAAGGTANRVAATADGSTMAMQQIVMAMIAANEVTRAEVKFGGANQTLTGAGSNSYQDLDAASMSITWPSSGGNLIAIAIANVETQLGTAGDFVQLAVSINGVTWGGGSYRVPTLGYYGTVIAIGMETPAAGNRTIKPLWKQGNTANTAQSYGSGLKMVAIELKR